MDEQKTTPQISMEPITSSPSLELTRAVASLRMLEELFTRATDDNIDAPESEGVSYVLGAIAGRLEGVANDRRISAL